jgi:hypothetical protein
MSIARDAGEGDGKSPDWDGRINSFDLPIGNVFEMRVNAFRLVAVSGANNGAPQFIFCSQYFFDKIDCHRNVTE